MWISAPISLLFLFQSLFPAYSAHKLIVPGPHFSVQVCRDQAQCVPPYIYHIFLFACSLAKLIVN